MAVCHVLLRRLEEQEREKHNAMMEALARIGAISSGFGFSVDTAVVVRSRTRKSIEYLKVTP